MPLQFGSWLARAIARMGTGTPQLPQYGVPSVVDLG